MATTSRQTTGFDGSRLLVARKQLGLTRAELARRLGTGWEVILQWEAGECQPRPRSLPAIASAVGLAVSDLFRTSPGAVTLAERRKAAGLNQTDVADALGVNRAAVSQWERGARPVPAHHRAAYNQLLGLPDEDTAILAANTAGASAPSQPKDVADKRSSAFAADDIDRGESPSQCQPLGPAARVAHLIVITDLEFSDGKFLGDAPKRWCVYSPQGTQVNKTSTTDLERLLEDAALPLSRLGYRQLCMHHEQRVIIDDEPIRVVRYQSSPPSDTRQRLNHLFMSYFTPDYYWDGVGDDVDAKAKIRREFEGVFPQSVTGEMLFVIAEPTDTYAWLQDQTLPYTPYTIVSYLPEANRYFFSAVHHDHTSVHTNAGLISLNDLGIQRDTTISEIAERLEDYRHP